MLLIRFNFQKQSWKSKFRGTLLQSSKWSAKLWWHHFQRQPLELLCKKVLLKILQNSQKNTCVGLTKETPTEVLFCFTEQLRKTTTVFYWMKKNMLVTRGWKEQRRYDTIMFLLEMFVQNLVLRFFGPKKIRCKTRKKHIETFYHWYRFYFMFDFDKTNILGPNYTVNFCRAM